MNFAELLKEVCNEAIAQGEDISKYGNVVIDSIDSLAGKGYELEPKSYYTTYYGQNVATTGVARGYFRYINDSHYGASGRSGRTIKLANPFEVDLV